MNTPKRLALALALAAPLAASAQHVNWTQWTPASTATGTTTYNGNPLTVEYTGQMNGLDFDASYFSNTASFTNAEVENTPGANGSVRMSGGTTPVNHIHLSAPVTNPYLALYSVGQPNVGVHFDFDAGTSITILSQGAGHWGGGTLMLETPTSVLGYEGNGILRLNGTYSDIYFTTPNYEYYYGFTLGVAAVPEPATYAMLLAGMTLLGAAARRRRDRR
ncbi:MAG TPA: PEPxxWA-CTERM sorting domain-containing protein [Telluria sp.]|nr:PEPxxWA-CTERM sorting domain-containing protein [Telluria sp.]